MWLPWSLLCKEEGWSCRRGCGERGLPVQMEDSAQAGSAASRRERRSHYLGNTIQSFVQGKRMDLKAISHRQPPEAEKRHETRKRGETPPGGTYLRIRTSPGKGTFPQSWGNTWGFLPPVHSDALWKINRGTETEHCLVDCFSYGSLL